MLGGYVAAGGLTLASLKAGKAKELSQRLRDPSLRASARASIAHNAIEADRPQLKRSDSAPQLLLSPRPADRAPLARASGSPRKLLRGSSTPNLHQAQAHVATATPPTKSHSSKVPPWRFYCSNASKSGSQALKQDCPSSSKQDTKHLAKGSSATAHGDLAAEALRAAVLRPLKPSGGDHQGSAPAGDKASAAAALRRMLVQPQPAVANGTEVRRPGSAPSAEPQQLEAQPNPTPEKRKGSNEIASKVTQSPSSFGDEQKLLLQEYSNLLQGVRDAVLAPASPCRATAAEARGSAEQQCGKLQRLSDLQRQLCALEEEEQALCAENERLRAVLTPHSEPPPNLQRPHQTVY
mmetsp:Transcript_10644/g.24246  ORF Transcript_10644/g.24246 Transcript_10644/m.24246 type:complete len:351 (-) Transcript_10644:88-1140(-)